MNDDSAKKATNQPVTLGKKVTPIAVAPAATAATCAIAPDAHLISSGLKIDTELFLKGSTNNMADKEKIETTTAPDSPTADSPDANSQYDGSADSNYPH